MALFLSSAVGLGGELPRAHSGPLLLKQYCPLVAYLTSYSHPLLYLLCFPYDMNLLGLTQVLLFILWRLLASVTVIHHARHLAHSLILLIFFFTCVDAVHSIYIADIIIQSHVASFVRLFTLDTLFGLVRKQ